jgi:hypothetical protein
VLGERFRFRLGLDAPADEMRVVQSHSVQSTTDRLPPAGDSHAARPPRTERAPSHVRS